MYTVITNQIDHMIDRIENCEVLTDPWPHMFIPEVIRPDDYRAFTEFEQAEHLTCVRDELSERDEYSLGFDSVADTVVRLYNKRMNKLFHVISDKFGLAKIEQEISPTVNFWKDTHKLLIDDIHIDAFHDTKLCISAMIYLPKDLEQKDYGTLLYEYSGTDLNSHALKDPECDIYHQSNPEYLDEWTLKRRIPFLPNSMFITVNNPNSWHQAPTNIREGDVRKSCMIRWKV